MSHGTVASVVIGFFILTSFTACNKWQDYLPDKVPDEPKFLPGMWSLSNALASNNVAFKPFVIDPLLVDSRGFEFVEPGMVWGTSHGMGYVNLYNVVFATRGISKVVQIPSAGGGSGKPAAVVVNRSAASFKLSNQSVAKIIIGSTDGILSGWNDDAGTMALVIKNNSPKSVYTGLTIGTHNGQEFLYAANFGSGKIEVFDQNFSPVHSKKFIDPLLPKGFSPFNVRCIEDYLVVTYAKPAANGEGLNEQGNGIINIFTLGGNHVKRLATKGILNSPWGITILPAGFLDGINEPTLLVANHGNGRLTGFSPAGKFLGELQDSRSNAMVLTGIWGLSFETPGQNNALSTIYLSVSRVGGNPTGYIAFFVRF